MDTRTLIVTALELAGTVAFAASGAMVGIRRGMDVFGVCVLGCITAVGGAMPRDIILGTVPGALIRPVYTTAAILTALAVFAVSYFRRSLLQKGSFGAVYERAMLAMDAVGLGIFTVMGIRTAMALESSHINNIFLLVFVGVTTGIGGGMMRDVMAGNTPFVFIKHVYACAALIGAFLYIFLYRLIPDTAAMLISSLAVVAIRLLAAHYRCNLPRIQK